MFGKWNGDWFNNWYGSVEVEIDDGGGGPPRRQRISLPEKLRLQGKEEEEILYIIKVFLISQN